MANLIKVLWSYCKHKNSVFKNKTDLDIYQQRRIATLLNHVCKSSPYFSKYQGQPLSELPLMDKNVMLDNFDAMNTKQLVLSDIFETAISCEKSRDFSPVVRGITVGLSSGTSSRRGIFVASPAEQETWSGAILSKVLPDGLFAGERIALFLRANSNLYKSVATPWISFKYFDLFSPISELTEDLRKFKPTILVAPAQVLVFLAKQVLSGSLTLLPKKVVSCAEVLDDTDRALVSKAFGTVHEIYQATEGFIACTCKEGTLHLNEDILHIEKRWLDGSRTRFTPIITDFSRTTQPIIRYSLDDILVLKEEPCKCGSVLTPIAKIEGRLNDYLLLPGSDSCEVTVFADVLSRAVALSLPLNQDYQIIQLNFKTVSIISDMPVDELCRARDLISLSLNKLGVDTSLIEWKLSSMPVPVNLSAKKRKIIREPFTEKFAL